jgi:hypothetical protein
MYYLRQNSTVQWLMAPHFWAILKRDMVSGQNLPKAWRIVATPVDS